MPKYKVLDNLNDGEPHAPGDTVELSTKDAKLLIATGVVKLMKPKPPAKPGGGSGANR